MIGPSDLKRGILLDLEGAPWVVMDIHSQSPSARGAATITKVKARNLLTGQVLNWNFRSGDTIATADCERKSVQYLYREENHFYFMDQETYEQFALDGEALGDSVGFLLDGMECRSMSYNDEVFSVELPNTVELVITETAPNVKGATAQAQLKHATLETGIEVLVPPYLSTGEKIRVDTRTGKFVERVR